METPTDGTSLLVSRIPNFGSCNEQHHIEVASNLTVIVIFLVFLIAILSPCAIAGVCSWIVHIRKDFKARSTKGGDDNSSSRWCQSCDEDEDEDEESFDIGDSSTSIITNTSSNLSNIQSSTHKTDIPISHVQVNPIATHFTLHGEDYHIEASTSSQASSSHGVNTTIINPSPSPHGPMVCISTQRKGLMLIFDTKGDTDDTENTDISSGSL